MSMEKYSQSVVKTCFLQLRKFRPIRTFIPKSAGITLANAFIHLRIDYCHSLFMAFQSILFFTYKKA